MRLASAAPPPPSTGTGAGSSRGSGAAAATAATAAAASGAAAVPPPLSLVTLEPSDFAIEAGCGGEGARAAALAAVRYAPYSRTWRPDPSP